MAPSLQSYHHRGRYYDQKFIIIIIITVNMHAHTGWVKKSKLLYVGG